MAGKTTSRRTTGTTVARRKRTTTRAKKSSANTTDFLVPLFFMVCILFCLGFLIFTGYRTVTASSFFDVENVELEGVKHIKQEKIKQIVKSRTSQEGVWNSDLETIRSEIETFKYAKEVSVSRVLPDTVRVIVRERVPVALIRTNGKDYWVDDDALVLDRVAEKDQRPPFVMFGWNLEDSEKAQEINKKRVALYRELLENWKSYDLAKRVKAVDLTDLKEPQAIIEDSGETVRISLSDGEYGKRLQKGIEITAGRGKEIEKIDVGEVKHYITYRKS